MIFGSIKGLIKLLFALPIVVLVAYYFNTSSCSEFSLMPTLQKIQNVSITEIQSDSIRVNLDAIIYNKNQFALNIDKLNLSIKNKNNLVGKSITTEEVKLLPDSLTSIPMVIYFDTKKMFEILSTENDSVQLDLIGNVKIKSQIADFEKSVNFPLAINIREIITNSIFEDDNNSEIITVINAELLDITPSSSKLAISFKVNNPYDLSYTILDYPAIVKINGKESGKGNLTEKIEVIKNELGTKGKMLFVINNFKSTTSLLTALLNRKIEYETIGYLKIRLFEHDFNMPFSIKGDLL